VLSDDGALIGIISQGDVLRRLGHLEPLVVERSREHVYAGSTFVR
jgi:hypothetical protein